MTDGFWRLAALMVESWGRTRAVMAGAAVAGLSPIPFILWVASLGRAWLFVVAVPVALVVCVGGGLAVLAMLWEREDR